MIDLQYGPGKSLPEHPSSSLQMPQSSKQSVHPFFQIIMTVDLFQEHPGIQQLDKEMQLFNYFKNPMSFAFVSGMYPLLPASVLSDVVANTGQLLSNLANVLL